MATRLTHRKANRLGGRGAFKEIRETGVRASARALTGHFKKIDAPSRLGISIGRQVGNAVKRNRIKRLLREAFRLSHRDWKTAVEVVITVRPHQALTLGAYQGLLRELYDAAALKMML